MLNRIRTMIDSSLWGIVLVASGVRCGRRLVIAGRPIVSGARLGKLQLSDRVELVSDSSRTNLGVRAPTILRLLAPGAILEVGRDTGISGATICAAKAVRIGERCLLGADVLICDTDFHDLEPSGRRYGAPAWDRISAPVEIGDDVFIGTRTIVLKGVTIGSGATIGAGSVVSRSIPGGCVAVGVPAKVVSRRAEI